MHHRQFTRTTLQLGFATYVAAAATAHACWEEAASRYQVSSKLLYAIARTESALNPQAIGRNSNGTRDIGLMQINSAWLPTLSGFGISERDLYEPCTSIHVGAWILAGNIQRLGYTWDAVGAYNTPNPKLARTYIDKVRRHLHLERHHDQAPLHTPSVFTARVSNAAASR